MKREIETTRIERRDSSKRYSLSLEEVGKIAKEGVVIPVYRTLPSDLYTPVLTYLQLLGEKPRKEENPAFDFSPSFLLESVEGGERIGRYSYIGISPNEGIVVRDNEISELKNDGKVSPQKTDKSIDPLKVIQNKVSKTIVRTPGLPPFVGGYVGDMGYEVINSFETTVPKSNPDTLGIPEAVLFNYDNVIVFDHVRNELKVVGNIHVEDLNDVEKQYEETTSKIDQIVDRLHSPILFESKKSTDNVRGDAQSNFEKEEYIRAIKRIKEYIVAGDVIQVVMSQRWARKTEADPFSLYRALRRINPSPFMVYFNFGNFQIIGASPELLLKVEDRNISTWPIAGTRPRGQTPEEDERLAEELKNDPKENAEHNMLVDLGRNDVGRVSVTGTVKVPRLKEVGRFSHVMHMTSEVRGRLSDEYTSLDAWRTVFAASTVSCAPKIWEIHIINELEREKRGAYAGAMGYVSYDGDLEMAITIRTLVFKDGTAYIQAGGGIVYDSNPNTEWEETVSKSKASLRAIDLAEEEY